MPRTGTAAVTEPYRSLYFGYGGATGILSWPNSQSAAIGSKPGGGGQSFLNGSIYTSDATGIHSVIGAVRAGYFGHGGALGWLGWPTEEAQTITNTGGPRPASGSLQAFEGGESPGLRAPVRVRCRPRSPSGT